MPTKVTEAEAVVKILEFLQANNDFVELQRNTADPLQKEIIELIESPSVRSKLSRNHNVVTNYHPQTIEINKAGVTKKANQGVGVASSHPAAKLRHSYVAPPFHEDVVKVLTDETPQNMFFVGPTGCGKTEYVGYLGKEVGMALYKKPYTVYHVNGRHDMDTSGFLGDKTIDIDPKTCQNFIKFIQGPVVKAMTHGLDAEGKEIPGEAPGLLFIDELAVLPTHILISLNRLLETRNKQREITIDMDGGRVVKSHSGFRIICAANTIGRGFVSGNDALYSAQGDALDISTLDRLKPIFKFGYNRAAEKSILQEKLADTRKVEQVLNLRNMVRSGLKKGELQTPFSTRTIVSIADMYRIWRDLSKAVYYAVLTSLPHDEAVKVDEFCHSAFGNNPLQEINKTDEFDFME